MRPQVPPSTCTAAQGPSGESDSPLLPSLWASLVMTSALERSAEPRSAWPSSASRRARDHASPGARTGDWGQPWPWAQTARFGGGVGVGYPGLDRTMWDKKLKPGRCKERNEVGWGGQVTPVPAALRWPQNPAQRSASVLTGSGTKLKVIFGNRGCSPFILRGDKAACPRAPPVFPGGRWSLLQ